MGERTHFVANQSMYSISCSSKAIGRVLWLTLVVLGLGCQEEPPAEHRQAARDSLESARVDPQRKRSLEHSGPIAHEAIGRATPMPEQETSAALETLDVASDPLQATPELPILRVHVSGAQTDKGVYFCALFDDEEKLKQRKDPVRFKRFPASTESITWSINTLAPGEYAIAVFHDANENDIVDRHPLGFPTEAYGFSHNARGKFGPPPYDKIRFQLADEPLEFEIRVQ